VVIYQGMHRKEVYNPTQNPQPDIVVTSYPVLRIDAELLWGINWHAAILDESQHIKNAESQTAHAAFRLKAKHRFVMTGTPLENRLDDLWSQYNFVMPGFLGRRKSFLQNYSVRPGSVTLDAETLKARLGSLRDRILPFLLRRLKQDVATELPERTEMSLHVELSEAEQRIYATVRDAYRAQVFSAMSEQGRRGARLTILEALLRLRQASCHPSLLPFEEAKELGTQHGSSKIRTLVETLDEIVAEGHKALVFSQWTSLLDLAQEELTKAGIAQTRLDGSTRDREGVVNAFQAEDGPPVFLLSLKAGGTGLNLTAADYVLHLDPWWNPAVEAQANDRAHRIGQTRPVVVIKLVAAGTVEEKVVSLQRQKRALFDATVSQAKSLEDMLSDDDLKALLADGDDSGLAGAAGAPPPPRAAKTVKRKAPAKKGSDDAAKPPPDSAPPPPARKTVRRRRSPAPAKSRADAPKSREAPGAPEASSPSGDPMLNSIMDLVRDREGVTTREVQDLLGLSSDDALLALRDLIARGLITRTGRGPSVRYLPAEAA